MDKKPTHPSLLRAEAETQLLHLSVTKSVVRPVEELLHELGVYQIELEIQSEELRRAYVDLEESCERYVDLYDFAPVGYLILTREGLIAEINLTAAGLLGEDRRKLLRRRFAAFVSAQDGDGWHLFFSSVMKHNERQSTELTLKRCDGTEFPVQLDCLCASSADKDSMLRITLTDITKRKQAEAALHEVETSTLSIALASAQMGSWVWDIESGHVVFNERWAKIRGYRLEEIEPYMDSWEDDIHLDDFPAYHAALTAHLENRSPFYQAEYRVRSQSGAWIWLFDRGTVIKRDGDGNPLRMAGIEMGITERRRNDEELRIAAIAFESQEGVMVPTPMPLLCGLTRLFAV